jgi:uncharacterized protein
MQTFLQSAWLTTVELAPWLLLGALVAGVLHVLVPRDFVRRQLTGRWSVVKAVALGVPLPLCSCGVIPVAISLREQRASRGATVGFLISTPQTGVDSILVSAAMLGWPFAVFKVLAALVTGVVGGWITNAVEPPSAVLPTTTNPQTSHVARHTWRDLVDHALEILHSIWGWLVVGVLLSAAISTMVSESALHGLAGYGGLAAMAVALAVSLPLYVCATASVPIAAALVAGGLPTGAALVLLMAGPATNAATIGAIKKTIGGRALLVYVATIVVGSMAAGMLFDYVLAPPGAGEHVHHHPATWWGIASAVVLLALVGWFAVHDVARRLRSSEVAEVEVGEASLSVPISGMTCQGCASTVESALRRYPAIRTARVTLDPPEAVVVGKLSRDEVREVVERAGYAVLSDPVTSSH